MGNLIYDTKVTIMVTFGAGECVWKEQRGIP